MASKALTFEIFGKDVSASKALHGINSSVGTLKKSFGELAGAIGIAFTIDKIADFGKESVSAFYDAEKAQNKLTDAFERFPAFADVSRASLNKLNKSLELKSGFDDDSIASGEAVLGQFKLTGQQVKQIIPLIVDYAKKTGMDVPTAAQNIGKAMLGNTRALKAVGIEFKATGDTATDFNTIFGDLQTHVGGFADKEATTAAGKVEILGAKFEDLKEKVGDALTKGFEPFVNWATSPAGTKTIDQIGSSLAGVIKVVTNSPDPIGTMVTAVGILTGAFIGLDLAMDANPVGAVILGFTLATAALVAFNAAINDPGLSQGIANIATGVYNFVVGIEKSILGVVTSAVNAIIDGLNVVVGPLNAVLSAAGLSTIKLPHLSGANFSSFAIDLNGQSLTAAANRDSTSVSGGTGASGVKRAFADGAIIRATPGGVNINGTFAEKGHDEAIIPLTGKNMAAAGLGGSPTFHLYQISDTVGTANAVLRRLNLGRA